MIRMLEGICRAKKSFTTLYVNRAIVRVPTTYIYTTLIIQLFRPLFLRNLIILFCNIFVT